MNIWSAPTRPAGGGRPTRAVPSNATRPGSDQRPTFSISFEDIVVSARQDLFALRTSNRGISGLVEWGITRKSPLGFNEGEMLTITERSESLGPSGGANITPRIMQDGQAISNMFGIRNALNPQVSTRLERTVVWDTQQPSIGREYLGDIRNENTKFSWLILRLEEAPITPITLSGYLIYSSFGR